MGLSWKFLKEKVYYFDGAWLDIYVLNATQEDWLKWAEYVNGNYELSFYNYPTDAHENKISLSVLTDYWNTRGKDSEVAIEAAIQLGTIPIKCHFFNDTQIENDFDPGDIKNMDDHYKIINYLSDISKLLNKPVVLTPENTPSFELITVSPDVVKIKAY